MAIKRTALVLMAALLFSCAAPSVTAHNMGPLPPKETFVFVDSNCGGTNLAVEGARVLAVTARHCFQGTQHIQIHDSNWNYLGEGELFKTEGDVAYIYYYPPNPYKAEVATVGSAPLPGDGVWYYGYNFATSSFMPTLGWFTPETATFDGISFYIVSGPVIHGFSGTGVFINSELVGVVNIGMFGMISRQANWMGMTIIDRKDIPYEQNPADEKAEIVAPPLMPFMQEPDRL